MDQHVPRAITVGLRQRQIDVVTAYEDGASTYRDTDLLDRATHLDRGLFTQDDDFLVKAARRQAKGRAFAGIVYAHQQKVTIGLCVEQLQLIAVVLQPSEIASRVIYLPI